MALNMKTLGTRALTALVFVLVLLGGLLWNYYSFSLLFFAVAMMGLNEFYKISAQLGAQPYRVTGFILGAFLYGTFFVYFRHLQFALVLIPFLVLVAALFHKREQPVKNAVYTMAGLLYAVLPFGLMHYLVVTDDMYCHIDFAPATLLGIILLIWSNDTFAYLGGSIFGKNKMIARISPGKTWEGTLFGVLMTVGASYLVARFFIHQEIGLWLVLGAVVPVLATLGDLVESQLKRQAGIKDSGSLMPGHGGILDRFDSLIFVTPFVFVILKFIA